MEDMRVTVSGLDYALFTGAMLFTIGIGIYIARKEVAAVVTIEKYLLGNRRMHVIPVAFSMVATNFSANLIAGATAEMYLFGLQFVIVYFVYSVAIGFVGKFIVPAVYSQNYVSIYEYIEKRFDSRLRLIFSIFYLLGTLVFLGVGLYLPAVSLTVVSGLPMYVTVLLMGVSCTIYCSLGGFKAILWTDVSQAILMALCLALFVLKGTIDAGGFKTVFEESINSNFLRIVSWYDDISYRHSVIGLVLLGFYYALKDTVVNQSGAQRLFSVKNMGEAQMICYLSAGISIIFSTLLALSGIILYTTFHSCNPLEAKRETGVNNPDQMFIYGSVKFLRDWPGISGFALAGIMSGSISTVSSYINAFAAITLEDYLKPLFPRNVFIQEKQVLICKILTGFYGVLAISCAFVIPLLGGAMKASVSTIAITSGPMSGVLLLGIFVKRANSKVALMGLFAGVAVCLTLQIGNMIEQPKYKTTHLTRLGCTFYNETIGNLFKNSTEGNEEISGAQNNNISPLSKVAFILYGPIGLLTSFIFGYVISFCSKPEGIHKTLRSLVKQREEKRFQRINSWVPQVQQKKHYVVERETVL